MSLNSVNEYTITLGACCLRFAAGHRIRVQVTSSNFRAIDCNPNAGGPLGIEGPYIALQDSATVPLNTSGRSLPALASCQPNRDLRLKAGELKEWHRQVPIELRVNDIKICTYTIDFLEVDKNDNEMWMEIKGFAPPEWNLKWKLFEAIHPDWEKQVIN